MNMKHKYFFRSIFFVVILVSIVVFIVLYDCQHSIRRDVRDDIEQKLAFAYGDDVYNTIHPFRTGSFYVVVLPAGWSIEKIRMLNAGDFSSNGKEGEFSDKEQKIDHSKNIVICLDTPMRLDLHEIGIEHNIKIAFYQSNVPSVYIATRSGSMTDVDASTDKSFEEEGTILVSDVAGEISFQGNLKSVSGHGNFTWKISKSKKPYNIEIKQKCSILSLKEDDSFCLIANNADPSQVRNWIAYKASQLVCPTNSVGCEYVSLWTNGEYRGLYILTNKVSRKLLSLDNLEKETQGCNKKSLKELESKTIYAIGTEYPEDEILKGRLDAKDPDNITGDYLLEMHPKVARDVSIINAESGFRSSYETRYGLKSPKHATLQQVQYLKTCYDQMAEALYSEKGIDFNGITYSELIDISSFAKLYMLQELFANSDCNKSVFIYKKKNCSTFYAAPLWDMDLTMGLGGRGYDRPDAFYVRMPMRLSSEGTRQLSNPGFWPALCQHTDFNESVSQIFSQHQETLLSYFDGTDCLIDSIMYSIMHDVRFDGLKNDGHFDVSEWKRSVDEVKSYMSTRIAFLSRQWLSTEVLNEVKVTIDYKWNTSYTLVQVPIQIGSQITLPKIEGKAVKTIDGKDFNPEKTLQQDVTLVYENVALSPLKRLYKTLRRLCKTLINTFFTIVC